MFLRLIPHKPLRLRIAQLQASTMTLPLYNTSTGTAPTTISTLDELPRAVAVYCGANPGTVPAFQLAATC
jgi:hypothetical protein